MSQTNSELNIDPNGITLFAQTNFRNQQRRFGIKLDDRRRHMYVLGKTGMGKTTLLENMVLSDIYAGHGCAYIDPHGDTAEKILDYIPSWRINDVVYFNPADLDFPIGFNILETINDEQKHLVASGLMGVFKKIWPDVWSPRMEYILLNCVMALLDFPGATLLGINRLLVDKEYRQRVVEKIRDPIVKTFWVAEFTSWSEKYATEAVAPVQNKVGQFLSASVIRNILAQVKSTINPRDIMDNRKIFIVNLSKGRIGEDNMRLLGGLVITKLQLAAMERVDIPEEERKDFFMYVDEFQNFATPAFANILSEARKYRLALIMAHQYIEQLDETVRDAVFGNVGSLIIFRVGSPDAAYMETEFAPTFLPEDLTNLPKFGIYLKLMVDGVSTEPFSATTLPPIAQRTGSAEKVIAVSRERYAMRRQEIEDKVLKWSGMEAGTLASSHSGEGEEEEGDGGMEQASAILYPKIKTREERESEGADDGEEEGEKDGGHTEYLRFSPDRLAAIAKSAPAGSKKKDKPKFKHTCSRCGAVWEMPIQLDPTRPMYCSECLPLIREEQKVKGKVIKAAVSGRPPEGVEIEEVPSEARPEPKKKGSLEVAMRAIEDGGTFQSKKKAPPEPNRPRIVVENRSRFAEISDTNEDEMSEDDDSPLLLDITERRGVPVDRHRSITDVSREPSHGISAPRQPDDGRPLMSREAGERGEEERHKRKRKRRERPKPEEKRRDSLDRHFSRVEQEGDRHEPVSARESHSARQDRTLSAQSERHHDDHSRERSMPRPSLTSTNVPRNVASQEGDYHRPPEDFSRRPSLIPANAPRVIPPSHGPARDDESGEIAQRKNLPTHRLTDSPISQLDNPSPKVNHGDEGVSDSSKTVFRAQRPSSPSPSATNRPTVIQGGIRVQPGQRITFDS